MIILCISVFYNSQNLNAIDTAKDCLESCYLIRYKLGNIQLDGPLYLILNPKSEKMPSLESPLCLMNNELFRFTGPADFLEISVSQYADHRESVLDTGDWHRDDLFLTNNVDIGQLVDDYRWIDSVNHLMFGHYSTVEESKLLDAYMELSKEDSIPIKGDLNLTIALPNGAPLIQHLRAAVKMEPNCWMFPSRIYLDELSSKASINKSTYKTVVSVAKVEQ